MTEPKPNAPKFLDMAIVTGVLVAAFVYFVISLNTRDMLWFWPTFDEVPRKIGVYCYGNEVEVPPGAGFEAITQAVNEALSGSKRWDQMTMSDETYQDYQQSPQMMTLKLVYDPAVRIHSFYSFYKNVNQLLIPLDGRHANTNAVFGRVGEYTEAGSLHVKSTDAILEAVESYGICQKP